MSGARPVMINPIGNDPRCWRFLGWERDFLAVEYPGHGDTKRQPGWSIRSFADRMVEEIEGPLDLVGMSFGAAVALDVVARHPERVRSAVLCCNSSVANATQPADYRRRYREMLLARAQRGLDNGMESVLDETLERWFTPFALRSDHAGVRYAREALTSMAPDSWNDVWQALAKAEPLSELDLRSISVPITIVGGVHDRSANLRDLLTLHHLLPTSRYEVISGPHMLHLEQPQALVAALDRHLTWVPHARRVDKPIASFAWTEAASTVGVHR